MINTKDQEDLFKLISEYLDRDLSCIAIGGTAMMFSNYKTTTKDIDLVFESEKERESFILAIKQIGYKECLLETVYDKWRLNHTEKPLMFTRGDERFDLFVKTVFGYKLDFNQDKIIQRIDFLGKKNLSIFILSKEDLILLKSITGREKDFEDIKTILDLEKFVDWELIIKNAVKQKETNSWILIDLEETLQKLKDSFSLDTGLFELIYTSQD